MSERTKRAAEELRADLKKTLEFWQSNAIRKEDGAIITLGCDNRPLPDGRQSAVLTARMLWAFASAYRMTGTESYLQAADQSFQYLKSKFVDPVYGGVFELLDRSGVPLDEDKLIYTQSYVIYGCAEYYLAAKNEQALSLATEIFDKIEMHARRSTRGYIPACSRSWGQYKNYDRHPQLQGKMIMDTHLHLMESYTVLSEASGNPAVRERLKEIICIMLNQFLRENGALYQELSMDWKEADDTSDRFGDEAECTWMLCAAAREVGNPGLSICVLDAVKRMMDNLCRNGYDNENGGVFDRRYMDGSLSTDKLWWEESEAVIALLTAWKLHGEQQYLEKALSIWEFIKEHFITDGEEWNWMVHADGNFVQVENPYDPLKCPYHTTRIVTKAVPILEDL